MEKELTLTMKEKQRIEVVQHLRAGDITVTEAARLLARSERTVFRLARRLKENGLLGLVHGNRGKRSPRRTPEQIRKRVMRLATTRYADANDTHLSELLARNEKLTVGRELCRRWRRAAGLPPKRRRRAAKYRSRRERKAALGMMLQLDASPHDWLQGRGPWLTLVGAIDDATNFRWARFVPAETTWAYLDLMRQVISSHGVPQSLYSDRHSIFFPTREPTIVEQLKGQSPLTQFGRAMDELGVTLIPARSPQAKGRVERMWGVFQDRLVVELRLARANSLETANRVLERFLPDFNHKFRVAPAQSLNLFRPKPSAATLDHTLCLKDERTVQKDHTVSFEGLVLQIPPSKAFRSLAGRRVTVLQLQDASIQIHHQKRAVAVFHPQAVKRLVQTKLTQTTNLKAA